MMGPNASLGRCALMACASTARWGWSKLVTSVSIMVSYSMVAGHGYRTAPPSTGTSVVEDSPVAHVLMHQRASPEHRGLFP